MLGAVSGITTCYNAECQRGLLLNSSLLLFPSLPCLFYGLASLIHALLVASIRDYVLSVCVWLLEWRFI